MFRTIKRFNCKIAKAVNSIHNKVETMFGNKKIIFVNSTLITFQFFHLLGGKVRHICTVHNICSYSGFESRLYTSLYNYMSKSHVILSAGFPTAVPVSPVLVVCVAPWSQQRQLLPQPQPPPPQQQLPPQQPPLQQGQQHQVHPRHRKVMRSIILLNKISVSITNRLSNVVYTVYVHKNSAGFIGKNL